MHVLLNRWLISRQIWLNKHNLGHLCQLPLTFATHFTHALALNLNGHFESSSNAYFWGIDRPRTKVTLLHGAHHHPLWPLLGQELFPPVQVSHSTRNTVTQWLSAQCLFGHQEPLNLKLGKTDCPVKAYSSILRKQQHREVTSYCHRGQTTSCAKVLQNV